jgi:hypothetical protein
MSILDEMNHDFERAREDGALAAAFVVLCWSFVWLAWVIMALLFGVYLPWRLLCLLF